MCRIVPPKSFRPPFPVDFSKLKFTPRIQLLSELGAVGRSRTNFTYHIARFWEMQGITIRLPIIEEDVLDIYLLNGVVKKHGGFFSIAQRKAWNLIAEELGLKATAAQQCKTYYQKLLFPMSIFQEYLDEKRALDKDSALLDLLYCKETYGLRPVTTRRESEKPKDPGAPDRKRRRRLIHTEEWEGEISAHARAQLKKLETVGAGVKMAMPTYQENADEIKEEAIDVKKTCLKTVGDAMDVESTADDDTWDYGVFCRGCKLPLEVDLTQCSVCGISLHRNCVVPKPPEPPRKGEWKCPVCCIKMLIDMTEEIERDKAKQAEEQDQKPNMGKQGEGRYGARGSAAMAATTQHKTESSAKTTSPPRVSVSGEDDGMAPLSPHSGSEASRVNSIGDELNDAIPHFGMGAIKNAFSKYNMPYGFQQSERLYTIPDFAEYANKFKNDYFKRLNPKYETSYTATDNHGMVIQSNIPLELIEHEYWRLVDHVGTAYGNTDLAVEYGADIEVVKYGSGSPHHRFNACHKAPRSKVPQYEKYANSPWNMCNLAASDQCIFKRLDGDISGVKVPWTYNGCIFSTFAWHTEDHWAPAINYHHWGEPKVWYAAPENEATKLEYAIRNYAPDLYNRSLVHDVTTTFSPYTLMQEGVKVCRAVQCPGDYIIQFKRCYHAGFNAGLNFAEAVNYCTSDWADMGRNAVRSYRRVKRYNVFAHDELICRVAVDYAKITVDMADYICSDLKQARDFENRMRRRIESTFGVTQSRRESFENVDYDNRQCEKCQYLLFLSALKYEPDKTSLDDMPDAYIKPGAIFCLHHADVARGHGKHFVLLYRYSIADINSIISQLESHMANYKDWVEHVLPSLEMLKAFRKKGNVLPEGVDKYTVLEQWRTGLENAEKGKFNRGLKYWKLKRTYDEVEYCENVLDRMTCEGDDVDSDGEVAEVDTDRELITASDIQRLIKIINELPLFFDDIEPEAQKCMDAYAEFKYTTDALAKGFERRNWGIYDIPTLCAKLPDRLYPAVRESLQAGWPLPTKSNLKKFLDEFKQNPAVSACLDFTSLTEEVAVIDKTLAVLEWHETLSECLAKDRSLSKAKFLESSCPSHNSTIRPLSQLVVHIQKAEQFDRKCKSLCKIQPSPSIELLTTLELEASTKLVLNARKSLPGLLAIGNTIVDISSWREKVREYIIPQELNTLQKPTYDFVKYLQDEGMQLSVRDLGRDLELLDERLASAQEWIAECENLFIPKITEGLLAPYVLRDILMPHFTFLSSKEADTSAPNGSSACLPSLSLPIHAVYNNNNKKDRWIRFPRPVVAAQQIFSLKTTKSLKYYKHNERHIRRLVARLKNELMITDHLPRLKAVEELESEDDLHVGSGDESSDDVSTYNSLVSEEYEHCYRIRQANTDVVSPGAQNDIHMNTPELVTCYCRMSNDTRKVFEIRNNNNGVVIPDPSFVYDRNQVVRCCLCLKWWHKECAAVVAQKWDWMSIPFESSSRGDSPKVLGHGKSRRGTRSTVSRNLSETTLGVIQKFTCARCQKSLRPTPEQLLTLLLSLEKLEIQIFEGQLVQNLIERFLDWQGRTKRILTEVAKYDAATEQLLSFNHNAIEYPDNLKFWIQKYCRHELRKDTDSSDPLTRYRIKVNDMTRILADGEADEASDDESVAPPKLSSELLDELINIQVEGDLVEVRLPESDILWLVIRRFDLVESGCELWYNYRPIK